MEQDSLFYEDENEALKVDIQRLGGAKAVGHSLWPDKDPEDAGRYLLACLNPERREFLKWSQIIWIKREARKAGSFSAQIYENQQCGFAPPVPIEPEDEAAQLQRAFNESVKTQAKILARMERLSLPGMEGH